MRRDYHQRRPNSGEKGQKRNRNMGRAEWRRNPVDKRAQRQELQRSPKRRRVGADEDDLPTYATKFSAEEIAAQQRQPKRKVAVLLGYSGSGYKGMQLNHQEKTIEGDLFKAFVSAGAISKANADDAKKSSLVRCARTDKGVHAAGNLISLKMVIEDPDIVSKINEKLPPQIRVWGIERTNNSFSAYQLCDSRVYEYLIPTYSFLPPHPQSFLGKEIVELAEEENDAEGLKQRQSDVADFWPDTQQRYLDPMIQAMDPSIREEVLKSMHYLSYSLYAPPTNEHTEQQDPTYSSQEADARGEEVGRAPSNGTTANSSRTGQSSSKVLSPVEQNIRALKNAQNAAKRAWRIPASRLDRVRSVFSRFVGSIKFHNYTIDKAWRDPSALRVIKSFTVEEKPIVIGDTEWLSLKVHGQSFMMHQIRKMVSAATFIVRCGCHEGRIQDTYLRERISIPKAPSLGLLLERPSFDRYNEKLVEFGREPIDFGKHEAQIKEFKQREIYDRIFRVEEKEGQFLSFFSGLDSTRSASLLWVTSAGLRGTQKDVKQGEEGQDENVDVSKIEEEDEYDAQDEN